MISEREERMEQLQQLRDNGEAYSYDFDGSHTTEEIQEFDEGEQNLPDENFSTVGRVMGSEASVNWSSLI